MTREDLRRIAHTRALMLASSSFPPAVHLAFLETRGPHVGAGLGRRQVDDLVLRDVTLPAEQPELIRAVSEALIATAPAAGSRAPAIMLAAELVWFGTEHDGQLVGIHGGFFWTASLWVRRIHAVIEGRYPVAPHYAIESALHGHLWDRGMREAMISLPSGAPALDDRRRLGWNDSHGVPSTAGAFVWIRKAFTSRPTSPSGPRLSVGPAWQAVS